MQSTLRSILVTEVLPPPDLGPQEAQRRTARHQERVTAHVTRYAGEVLVRVGQGCVAALPDPSSALTAARALLIRPPQVEGTPARMRAALHLGEVHPDRPAIAQPGVAEARRLLESAGPNEILISTAVHEALPDTHLMLTPVQLSGPVALPGNQPRDTGPEPGASGTAIAGYRLLVNPQRARSTQRRPVSGWLMAGAVILATTAALSAMVAALLL